MKTIRPAKRQLYQYCLLDSIDAEMVLASSISFTHVSPFDTGRNNKAIGSDNLERCSLGYDKSIQSTRLEELDKGQPRVDKRVRAAPGPAKDQDIPQMILRIGWAGAAAHSASPADYARCIPSVITCEVEPWNYPSIRHPHHNTDIALPQPVKHHRHYRVCCLLSVQTYRAHC